MTDLDKLPSEEPLADTEGKSTAVETLQYDFENYLDGELESIDRNRNSAFVFVKLPDGTEEQFYVTDRVLRKANYYLNTKPGTKMRVRLTRDSRKNGQVGIGAIEKNSYVPPRPDARSLPWLLAEYTKERDPDKEFTFITVLESCELFNAPVDVYVPMRLLRNSGYEDGLTVGQKINVRIMCGERGLAVISVQYPENFKNPGKPLD